MSTQLKSKLNGFIFVFVFFPLALVLVIFNLQMWSQVSAGQYGRVNTLLENGLRSLADEVGAYEKLVGQIGENPLILQELHKDPNNTSELTAQDLLKGLGFSVANAEKQKGALMERPGSQALKALVEGNVALRSVLVTGVFGSPVAASFMPDSEGYRGDVWFTDALRKGVGGIHYTGVFSNDTFWISAALEGSGSEDGVVRPQGVIRLEVDVSTLLQQVAWRPPAETGMVILVAPEGAYAKGSENLVADAKDQVLERISDTYTDTGYLDGYRYSRSFALEGLGFEKRLRLVSVLKEPVVAASIQRKMMLYGLMSAFILLVIMGMARIATGRIAEQSAETFTAGGLMLHKLFPEKFSLPSLRNKDSAQMSKAFDCWVDDYRESVLDNMEAREFEMQRDLELARDFQLAYLNRPYPKVPDVHVPGRLRLKYHHHYKPAMALGGDFFEFTKLAHDTGGLFVADVMGHGTRSALVTSILRTLIGDNIAHGRNARHYLTEINKSFCELLDKVNLPHPLFASAFYFVADTTARAATFSTAGHPAPFHLKRYGHTLERLEVQPPHGAALGINPDEEYTGGACRLNVGDVFIFFTDGMYEAFNPLGQELGLRAIERVIRNKMHNRTEEIIEAILATVDDFTGHEPLHDDICIVAVEVTDEADEEVPPEVESAEEAETGASLSPETIRG